MSSVLLLDKTRKIGSLLHNNSESKVVFNDICSVMKDVLDSEVFVISRKGKLLGASCEAGKNGKAGAEDKNSVAKNSKVSSDDKAAKAGCGNHCVASLLGGCEVGKFIDKSLNERFLSVLSTRENVNLANIGFDFENANTYHGVIAPVDIAGKRFASLFIYKAKGEYDIDDIILLEYGATVVGLEMVRAVKEEHDAKDRQEHMAHSAVDTLSATELKALGYVLEALDGDEGILVTSKIADKVGITRSVIVNAIRKLESAGIIESHSAGMKGTYIKIVNDVIYQVVEED